MLILSWFTHIYTYRYVQQITVWLQTWLYVFYTYLWGYYTSHHHLEMILPSLCSWFCNSNSVQDEIKKIEPNDLQRLLGFDYEAREWAAKGVMDGILWISIKESFGSYNFVSSSRLKPGPGTIIVQFLICPTWCRRFWQQESTRQISQLNFSLTPARSFESGKTMVVVMGKGARLFY